MKLEIPIQLDAYSLSIGLKNMLATIFFEKRRGLEEGLSKCEEIEDVVETVFKKTRNF